MFYFCTYFDQHYLARGLALYRSLREHCPEFQLWVLCMDEAAYQKLSELKLPGLLPIAMEEFERNDEPLKIAKTNRSRIEYYFTCTPSLPLHVLNRFPEVDVITYIDADLFFFSSPVPLFEEMGKASVAIIGHRFPPSLKAREIFGLYNVGWLSFRRDADGLDCLGWWRDRCNEWCYDRLEGERFADQKYLNDWPTRFRNVVVLKHRGANVAPWNVESHPLSYQTGRALTIDNQPLIFFHFHGLKKITSWWYDSGWKSYGVKPSFLWRKRVYAPYLKTLIDVSRQLLSIPAKQTPHGLKRGKLNQPQRPISEIRQFLRQFRKSLLMCKDVLAGQYIFIVKGYTL